MAKNSILLLRNYMQYALNLHTKTYCTKTPPHYDIIIVGGGMVGTTLACTLGKNSKLSDHRILLLESGTPHNWIKTEKYSNRVSALNLNTYNLMNKIGAWKHIAEIRCSSVKNMQIWDAISDVMISFNHEEVSNVAAHIVENDLLIYAVGKELCCLKNVEVKNQVKIKEFVLPQQPSQNVFVHLNEGETFTCNLLLGCDGAQSQVRNAMGVNYISWKYDQMGVVATLKLSEANENVTAWQRFLPTGPIAILPLKNNLSSLVWATTPDHARALIELKEVDFVDKINDALWKPLDNSSIIQESTKAFNKLLEFFELPTSNEKQLPPKVIGVDPGSTAAFPLGFGHATNYVKQGVALVGDAAHRVHPLAGQGVNLGFGDVSTLNKILGEAVYSGRSLGQITDLQEYETLRQRHNFPTMVAIDGLHKLYNTEFPPIVLLRSLGLQFTHALNPLKKAIINQAAR
ncbi:hypothetical protein RN001_001403 [Aquatica leii]|uniref:Ubiquinone biosynthesis monooxygenase COQ6, mitochondrial n=1 Tax=Aquatica leii TaxID=1421715 RepID=A0AAN7PG00_9COLE|nr:hypothetical protein RN001_001403 [Aquatica leii]